jgi:FkbM family methyltransferase
MISLEKHLPEGTRLGTVLHIGAGDGSSIDSYLALAPKRLILVEGDPVTSAALEERAKTLPNASVIARPVSAEGGSLRWHRFNLAFLNGPLVPIGLSAVYPRLRPAETIAVESIAITQLVEAQEITQEPDHVNLLVLDVPGQETALLAALPQPLLSSFALIIVRSCQPGTFADADAMESTIEALSANYFRPIVRNNDEPTWPQALVRFDAAAHEAGALRTRIVELEHAHAEAARRHESERNQSTHTIEQLRTEQLRMMESLRSAEATVSSRAVEIERLSRERDEAARLAADRQRAAQDAETSRALVDALQASKQRAEQQMIEAQAHAAKVLDELEATRSQHQATEGELTKLRAELESTRQSNSRAEAELADTRQAMNLSVRLQTLRENDLKDLQRRYKQLRDQQRKQHELLDALAQRLTTANDYFQRLAATHRRTSDTPVSDRAAAVPDEGAQSQGPERARRIVHGS